MVWLASFLTNLALVALNSWYWHGVGRQRGRREGRAEVEAELDALAAMVVEREMSKRKPGETRPN